MPVYTIEDLRRMISPIAASYGVKSVSLFGSYSTGKATQVSDVDLKIEKGQIRTLYQICAFRLAVEDALRIPVDLITTETSDYNFLNMIAKDEVKIYPNA